MELPSRLRYPAYYYLSIAVCETPYLTGKIQKEKLFTLRETKITNSTTLKFAGKVIESGIIARARLLINGEWSEERQDASDDKNYFCHFASENHFTAKTIRRDVIANETTPTAECIHSGDSIRPPSM